MSGLELIGTPLLIFGGILIFLGALALVIERSHNGRLPGDPVSRKRNFNFYFPLVIVVVFSIALAITLTVTLRIFR